MVIEGSQLLSEKEGAGGIPLRVLLLASCLASLPPMDHAQPEPGVRESSDVVHGEPLLRSKAWQRRVENGIGAGRNGDRE